jgi:hypothetical protein
MHPFRVDLQQERRVKPEIVDPEDGLVWRWERAPFEERKDP